jgi:hypothetical protein
VRRAIPCVLLLALSTTPAAGAPADGGADMLAAPAPLACARALAAPAARAPVRGREDAAAGRGRAFHIDPATGRVEDDHAREMLRDALARNLRDRGYAVVVQRGIRLKPSVIRFDVDARPERTVVAVKASVLAIEEGGRLSAMLESGARVSATGEVTAERLEAYAARAMDAAARALCDDIAARVAP